MTVARQRMGRLAEELVAERLQAGGWEIVDRNARSRHGELDIVAVDGRTLVFIEVKAGQLGAPYGPLRPVHAIDERKQRQVRRLAAAWLAEHRPRRRYEAIRFDAIGITFDGREVVDVDHIRDAF